MTMKCIDPEKPCPDRKDGLCFNTCVLRAVQAGIEEGAAVARGLETDVTNEPL